MDELTHNLISVGQLYKAGHCIVFDDEYSHIMKKDKEKCIIKSKATGTIFPLDISLVIGKPYLCFLSKAVSEVSWLWYQELAHLSFRYIDNLVTVDTVQGLNFLNL